MSGGYVMLVNSSGVGLLFADAGRGNSLSDSAGLTIPNAIHGCQHRLDDIEVVLRLLVLARRSANTSMTSEGQ
jgi:hypothetical protein